MIKILKEVSQSQERLARGDMRPESNRVLSEVDRGSAPEKISAIAGLEFKQNLPVIKDTDPDLEGHLREFQSIIDCHALGRQGVRPYDMLTVFRKTLAPGSTRLKVYDTAIKRARKMGRLPTDAKEIFDEVVKKLRKTIRETRMERQERAERTFDELQMGRLPHSAFRAEWEFCLEELEDAGVDVPSEDTLYRKYLSSQLRPQTSLSARRRRTTP